MPGLSAATPGLVGREDAVHRLSALLSRAANGSPALAVLSGETGIGKTALLRHFVDASDVIPVIGSCVPVAGQALPFAPLTQALRALRRSGWADRVPLPPELERLLPATQRVTTDRQPSAASPLPLFEAVLELLHGLSRHRPVVHAVEDVHWADRSTLDLLGYLAGNLVDEPVLLVVTYRTDDSRRDGPLQPWLAELGRLPITQRLELGRLDAVDTRLLVARLMGGDPPHAVVEETIARSDGNPLFVEHLVAAISSGATELPTTLRELLHSRVARHDGKTRQLLRAASVIGRLMPLSTLARLVELPEHAVEEELRPAFEQHVLEVRPGNTVGFQHAALREVVYAELLPAERARWHRAAAEALSGHGDEDPTTAGEVARHWHLGGDLEKALASSVRAGYAAERIYAFADAHVCFTRAAQLLEALAAGKRAGPELTGLSRPVLLEHAAQAASLIGEHGEAVHLTTEALSDVRDPAARAHLLERLGAFEFIAGRGDRAQAAYREALTLLPPDEDSALACSLYAGTALVAAAWSRLDDARAAGQRALEMARRTGARREEGVALDALGVAAAQSGDPHTGADLLRRSLAIALEQDDPDDVGIVYVNLTHVLGLANLMDELVSVGREGIEAVRRRGLLRQYGGLLMSNLGEALIKSGRLDEADRTVRTALADLPKGIQAAPALLQSGRLALIRGDAPLAAERIEQARVIVEAEGAPDAWLREVCEALAETELWSGRPAAAYELAVDGLRLCCQGDEARFGGILVMLGLRALADQAETLRPHDHDRKRVSRQRGELLDLARRLAPDPLTSTHGPTAESQPVALTCLAELARLDGGIPGAAKERAVSWARAADAWQAAGRPWGTAYARWREAEARLRAGVDADAIAVLQGAWEQAAALGASRLAEELRALARWYRVDLVAASIGAAEPVAQLDGFGLTSREREVLAELAAGRTNQEIAESLFISAKTASVHVSNILRKMEVSGRQEAARIAHRLGFGRTDGH